VPRSLQLHPDHQSAIAPSLTRNGFLTQGDLAAHLEIALSTVNNFCRGIKVSVSKFEQICEALGLEPREIILPTTNLSEALSAPPSVASPSAPTQFFAYDPFWVGRQQLTHTLHAQLKDSCRLLLITGIAGVGKTALAERLSVELQQSDHPYRLLRENFDNQEQSIDFASVAARLLEGCGQSVSPEDRTNSQLLARRLVAHLQKTPTLILIDSLEQILQGNEQTGLSDFLDENFLSFFKTVLATDRFQSRFILTSQERPTQILEIGSRYRNFWQAQPLGGLSDTEQIALFEKTGLTLAAELIRIGKAYEGHPLALRIIIGEIGSRPFYGNVAAYWKRYGSEIEAVEKSIAAAAAGNTTGVDDKWRLAQFTRALQLNVQQRLEHTFERLEKDARYAYILLCETAVYRCPVPEDWWLSHLEDWQQSEAEQVMALEVLRDRYLVEETTQDNELLLKQHNLIRSVSLFHLKQLTFTL
jgi:DNA-binding Xre family transcriptional regulator